MIEKKTKLILLNLIFLAVLSLPVYAAPTEALMGGFNILGGFLEGLLKSTYAMFGLTVVIFTILFYNLYAVLLGKIPVFKGDKGPVSKNGKIVALCLALLSSMGLFGLIFLGGGAANVGELLTNFLGPFSTLAGMLLAFLFFGIIWFGFKDTDKDSAWSRALWGAGLVMIFIGGLMSRPGLFALGWLIAVLFLGIFLFKGGPMDGAGGGSSGGGGSGGGGGGGGSGAVGFRRMLWALQRLMNQYNAEFRRFVKYCNDILQTHYDYLQYINGYGPPSPPVSPAQWRRMHESRRRLDNLGLRIVSLINQITSHRDFPRMKPRHQLIFANLTSTWSTYITRTSNFKRDFVRRYRRGQRPA